MVPVQRFNLSNNRLDIRFTQSKSRSNQPNKANQHHFPYIYGPQTVEERPGRCKTNLLSNPCNLRSNFTCSCVFSTFFVPLSASVDEAISARICGGTYFPFSVADGGDAVVVGVGPVVAVDGDGAAFSGDDEGASWVAALEVVFAFVNTFRRSSSISSSSSSDSEV
jgi:hypothetical protein